MSGGYFNYVDSELKSVIFGWTNKYSNKFEDKEISELVWDVLDLIHEYDWYISGDNCRDTYLKAKREFKKKWLGDGDSNERKKRYIDDALEDIKRELYETFDIDNEGGSSA